MGDSAFAGMETPYMVHDGDDKVPNARCSILAFQVNALLRRGFCCFVLGAMILGHLPSAIQPLERRAYSTIRRPVIFHLEYPGSRHTGSTFHQKVPCRIGPRAAHAASPDRTGPNFTAVPRRLFFLGGQGDFHMLEICRNVDLGDSGVQDQVKRESRLQQFFLFFSLLRLSSALSGAGKCVEAVKRLGK